MKHLENCFRLSMAGILRKWCILETEFLIVKTRDALRGLFLQGSINEHMDRYLVWRLEQRIFSLHSMAWDPRAEGQSLLPDESSRQRLNCYFWLAGILPSNNLPWHSFLESWPSLNGKIWIFGGEVTSAQEQSKFEILTQFRLCEATDDSLWYSYGASVSYFMNRRLSTPRIALALRWVGARGRGHRGDEFVSQRNNENPSGSIKLKQANRQLN